MGVMRPKRRSMGDMAFLVSSRRRQWIDDDSETSIF